MEEENKIPEIIIFGIGGVGSWIAEYLVRMRMTNRIIIIDFDEVEDSNLNRQNYTTLDRNLKKVDALEARLCMLQDRNGNKDLMHTNIRKHHKQVKDEIDVITYNQDSIAILATDNIKSKRIIAKHFKHFLLINCDKDFVEIKNYMDVEENTAWDMGGGYNSKQDIISNVNSAIMTVTILKERFETFKGTKISFKFKPETHLDNVLGEGQGLGRLI